MTQAVYLSSFSHIPAAFKQHKELRILSGVAFLAWSLKAGLQSGNSVYKTGFCTHDTLLR